MPVVRGPANWSDEFRTLASTLGDAIRDYEQAFGVTITPYKGDGSDSPFGPGEPPKYFIYARASGLSLSEGEIVDIHIERDGSEICPKQDLSFRLLPNDLVEMGPMAC